MTRHIRLCEVKEGQHFFEEAHQARIYYIALEDARETAAGWECRADPHEIHGRNIRDISGRPVTLFEAFDAGAYRLRLGVDDD